MIEHRAAGGDTDRLATLAAALVRANMQVIVASATPSIQAAMKATRHIPIVMATAGDARRTGLVTSLARPGGNVTGLSLALVELAGKTVELLHETLPAATRFACVVHSQDGLHREFLAEAESSAKRSNHPFPARLQFEDRQDRWSRDFLAVIAPRGSGHRLAAASRWVQRRIEGDDEI